jgi:hypothetical protein
VLDRPTQPRRRLSVDFVLVRPTVLVSGDVRADSSVRHHRYRLVVYVTLRQYYCDSDTTTANSI